MPNADRTAAASLDHDLDALVTGTPEHDHASDPTSDPATSADLRRAAHQFHGLAARADRRAEGVATQQTLDSIWENVMNTHVPSSTTITSPATLIPGRRPRPHLRRPAISPRAIRWHRVANGLLAAVLILAIGTGLWRATNGFDPGEGGSDALPALTAQDATPDASTRVDLPTADDCTVEPLTIDQVIAITRDPLGYYVRKQTAGTSTPSAMEATAIAERRVEQASMMERSGITPEIIEATSATQRQWVACVMKGSYFQKWALEYPSTVRDEITRALPVLTSEEEARSMLQELQHGGTLPGMPPLTQQFENGVPLIDPDPAHSLYNVSSDGTWAGVDAASIIYDRDGNMLQRLEVSGRITNGYVPWHFTRLGDTGPWLIETVGGFRG